MVVICFTQKVRQPGVFRKRRFRAWAKGSGAVAVSSSPAFAVLWPLGTSGGARPVTPPDVHDNNPLAARTTTTSRAAGGCTPPGSPPQRPSPGGRPPGRARRSSRRPSAGTARSPRCRLAYAAGSRIRVCPTPIWTSVSALDQRFGKLPREESRSVIALNPRAPVLIVSARTPGANPARAGRVRHRGATTPRRRRTPCRGA